MKTIALRIDEELWKRISVEAKKTYQPMTSWILVGVLDRLPRETTAPVKEAPQEPAEGKTKHERAALIMPRALEVIKEQGHEWISVGDVAEILDTNIDDTALAMANLWMKEKATIQNREDNRNDIRKENVRYRAV